MKLKVLSFFAITSFFSNGLIALGDINSSFLKNPSINTQENSKANLKLLKTIHNHNEIFDDYSTGGIAP